MRIARLFTLTLAVSLLVIISCSDTGETLTTTESFTQGKNSISSAELSATSAKAYVRIDINEPGDFIVNPGNFREVTPAKWDGKSKLKSGVRYWGHSSELEKLAEVDERVRDFVEFRKRMKKDMDKKTSTKQHNPSSVD